MTDGMVDRAGQLHFRRVATRGGRHGPRLQNGVLIACVAATTAVRVYTSGGSRSDQLSMVMTSSGKPLLVRAAAHNADGSGGRRRGLLCVVDR